ncbi:MAG: hypothetical protein NTX25_17580 [Proteobacteria bacterium]|nr:hypothetical protein [Pseudomonadota bacterium]
MFFKFSFILVKILALSFGLGSSLLLAKGSNELIYSEPFDLAAGGTSLTRASQEGIVFANPALLPLGGAWLRWVGLQPALIIDRDLARDSKKGFSGAGDGVVDQLFTKSLHFGQTATLSFLNKNFAVSVFDRLELDVAGKRFGDDGLPSVNFGVEAYGGILSSFATRPMRWLSLGLTVKHLYAADPNIVVPVADQEKIKELTENSSSLKNEISINQGNGVDAGALLLLQGSTLDLSLGLKIEDLGKTNFTGKQASFPQTYNAGLGLALHGSTEVLHLSLDYRDIADAYHEKTFKKIYLGARIMFRNIFGLATGLYQGIPTFGVRIDFLLFKLGATAYGRELGTYPGDRQRNMYMIYMSLGF